MRELTFLALDSRELFALSGGQGAGWAVAGIDLSLPYPLDKARAASGVKVRRRRLDTGVSSVILTGSLVSINPRKVYSSSINSQEMTSPNASRSHLKRFPKLPQGRLPEKTSCRGSPRVLILGHPSIRLAKRYRLSRFQG